MLRKKDVLLFALLVGLNGVVLLSFIFEEGEYYQDLKCVAGSNTTGFSDAFKQGSANYTSFKYQAKAQSKEVEVRPREIQEYLLVQLCGAGQRTFLNCYYRTKMVDPKAEDKLISLLHTPPGWGSYKTCPRIEIIGIGAGMAYLANILLLIAFVAAVVVAESLFKSNIVTRLILPACAGGINIIAGLFIFIFAMMTFFGAYTCGDMIDNYEEKNDANLRACKLASINVYHTEWLMTSLSFTIISGGLCILSVLPFINE